MRALGRMASDVQSFDRSIHAPPSTDAIDDFLEERYEAVPTRRDLWTYGDLIDTEDGCDVPVRRDTPDWAA
jgi:hypothetical protein